MHSIYFSEFSSEKEKESLSVAYASIPFTMLYDNTFIVLRYVSLTMVKYDIETKR